MSAMSWMSEPASFSPGYSDLWEKAHLVSWGGIYDRGVKLACKVQLCTETENVQQLQLWIISLEVL